MPKKERITIYLIASKAQVSLATVSRVINNPEKVKEETRKRVLEVIKKYDYRPNAIARSLASKKPTFIGIIVPDFSRNSVAEEVNSICNIARDYGYQVMVFLAENNNRESVDVWKDIKASQVDGLLYLNDLDNPYDSEQINALNADLQTPIVIANSIVPVDNAISVNIDNFKAAYLATKELIDKGKKNIVFATTNRLYQINEEKERGYKKAMEEAALGPITFETSGKVEINKNHIVEFLNDYKKIDGLIGARDSITISFMNELLNFGYKVPEDVEVIGLQNTKFSKLARPTITSVDTPANLIAEKAIELLTMLMNEEEIDERDHKVDFSFVKRESTT